jgi:hypothetical protein
MLVNERTLITVLMELAPAKTFPSRFPKALGSILRGLGVDRGFIEKECAAMENVSVSRTSSRSLLGTMNTLRRDLEGMRRRIEFGSLLDELALRCANVPLSVLKDPARWPDQELFAILDGLHVDHQSNPYGWRATHGQRPVE